MALTSLFLLESLISVAGPMAECVDISVTSLTIEWSDVSSDITSWTLGVYKGAQFVKVKKADLCLPKGLILLTTSSSELQ